MGCGSCFNESNEGKGDEGKKVSMGCCCCDCGEKIIENKIHTKLVTHSPDRTLNEIDDSEAKKLVDKQFYNAALERNNVYRNLHGVGQLKKDDYLYKMAFILAKQKLREDTLKYNNLTYKNHDELGMNVLICDKKLDGEQLMDEWYDEINNYNFIEPNEYECVDFTQMIWKNSEKFGCGYYCLEVNEENENNNNENQSKKYCYVALYHPAGNIPGKFTKNVFRRNIQQNENQRVSSTENILTLAENH